MENNSFKSMSEKTKRAILMGVIIKKTEGKLSKEELEEIISKINIGVQYSINVFTNAVEFSKVITLKNIKDSWAGYTENVSTGHILLGNVVFGEDYRYSYNDNDTQTNYTVQESFPDFNIYEKIVVTIEEHNFSNFNGNYYDTWKNSIFIYLPEDVPYKISPEVQYIIDDFKI
ncbi:MAG: hypothetical protein M0P99_06135 [Candidatus Cloacimonetes bacterium]|nr:hypothetical protein [Candidatus Cloacimonadota bacterium]